MTTLTTDPIVQISARTQATTDSIDWAEIAEAIHSADGRKWDHVVNLGELSMAKDGRVTLASQASAGLFGMGLRPQAIAQLATLVDPPIAYWRALEEDGDLELLAHNFNERIARVATKRVLVRGISDADGIEHDIRAVLSDTYLRVNLGDSLPALRRVVEAQGEGRIHRMVVTDDEIRGLIYFPERKLEVTPDDGGISPAIDFGNAENGTRRLVGMLGGMRWVCSNGQYSMDELASFGRVHRGGRRESEESQVRKVLRTFERKMDQIMARFPAMISGLQAANRDAFGANVEAVLAEAARAADLTKVEAKVYRGGFEAEPIATRYGAIQAITRGSQELSPAAGYEMDQKSRALVGMTSRTWSRLINRAMDPETATRKWWKDATGAEVPEAEAVVVR